MTSLVYPERAAGKEDGAHHRARARDDDAASPAVLAADLEHGAHDAGGERDRILAVRVRDEHPLRTILEDDVAARRAVPTHAEQPVAHVRQIERVAPGELVEQRRVAERER
jgi:hypothetical protein